MAATPQPSWPLSWIGRWHHALVFERRTRVLAEMLAAQIPQGASVLDIGCGDGTIGSLIAQLRPDISIQGVEFLVLTYNYQSRKEWAERFSECGLEEVSWTTQVPLYPPPFSLLVGRGLHFVSLLRKRE